MNVKPKPHSWWCSKCGRSGGCTDQADAQDQHDRHGDCNYVVGVIRVSDQQRTETSS